MNTRPIIVGLIILVAGLAGWATRIDAMLAAANDNIAALDKILAGARKEAAVAQAQIKPQSVAIVSRGAAPGNGSPAAGNQAPADPQAMLAAAQELPPGPARDRAMQAALVALAAIDPQTAWDLAQNLPDNGSNNRLPMFQKILAEWSVTDPAKAAELLATLSTQEDSDSATNTTATIESNWLKQDPVAASQWIETLPVGNTRDSAIMALALGATGDDLPTAFTWVTTMADPNKRGGTINKVVAQWAQIDPVAAKNAVLAKYTNDNNGRQSALLAIIARAAPDGSVDPSAAGGGASAP